MGAEVSVVPRSHTHWKIQCKGPSLQAINNAKITTYCTCSLTFYLGLHCKFRRVFIIVDISKAILGADIRDIKIYYV